MQKEAIADLLLSNHLVFMKRIRELSIEEVQFAPEGKWSALEQLDHIVKSVSPVNMALGLPKFIVKWRFGVANRPSKTFEELVAKYNRKLTEGGRASGRFVSLNVGIYQKEELLKNLTLLVKRLCDKTVDHSEEALDKYLLPHPLLGKLTFREMLYFTAYHVEHHLALVNKGLEQMNS
ncbi:MAG: hypothetical protein RLZZ28_2596 [Bacteroidota bacterium]